MTNYIELKRLAEHAFNGPWTFTEIDPDDKSWGACELQNKDGAFIATHVCGVFNASYIASASPDVVLGLIAEIDRLRTQNRALGLTDEALNVLWNFAVETGNPTAGNAHLRFARAIIAAINAKESK